MAHSMTNLRVIDAIRQPGGIVNPIIKKRRPMLKQIIEHLHPGDIKPAFMSDGGLAPGCSRTQQTAQRCCDAIMGVLGAAGVPLCGVTNWRYAVALVYTQNIPWRCAIAPGQVAPGQPAITPRKAGAQ